MKCEGHPGKSCIAQVDSSKRKNEMARAVLDVKLNLKTLDKRECEEFEMAFQHKSKLHISRELKQVGFAGYRYRIFKVSNF